MKAYIQIMVRAVKVFRTQYPVRPVLLYLKNSIRNYQQLLATGQNENQKLSANLKDREKTIAELQKMIDQQNKKVKDLLSSVKDAGS